jgi:hypothetical protein
VNAELSIKDVKRMNDIQGFERKLVINTPVIKDMTFVRLVHHIFMCIDIETLGGLRNGRKRCFAIIYFIETQALTFHWCQQIEAKIMAQVAQQLEMAAECKRVLQIRDMQLTTLMVEHEQVLREHQAFQATLEVWKYEKHDAHVAHEMELFIVHEQLAAATVQVEELKKEVQAVRDQALEEVSKTATYVTSLMAYHAEAIKQKDAEMLLLFQHVDTLAEQLRCSEAMAQAFGVEILELRENGVEASTCLLHALLVAVGAPLTQALSVTSHLHLVPTLTPTTSSSTRRLIVDLVPRVVELLSNISPWGEKLMRFCGLARQQALEELLSTRSRSLRDARVGFWDEKQGTLYC